MSKFLALCVFALFVLFGWQNLDCMKTLTRKRSNSSISADTQNLRQFLQIKRVGRRPINIDDMNKPPKDTNKTGARETEHTLLKLGGTNHSLNSNPLRCSCSRGRKNLYGNTKTNQLLALNDGKNLITKQKTKKKINRMGHLTIENTGAQRRTKSFTNIFDTNKTQNLIVPLLATSSLNLSPRNTPQLVSKGVQTPSKLLALKKDTDQHKKQKKVILDDIDIEFRLFKRKNSDKKILGVDGAVFFYDIRNFTFFSNKTPKGETPAFFMANLSDIVEKIVYDWQGYIISIPGDAYVVLFPKKKSEAGFQQSVLAAYLCAIETICETVKFMAKNTGKYYPKRCDLGLEIGETYFYKLDKFKKIVRISGVSKVINNAQRYEDHAKKSTERKITTSEKIRNIIRSTSKTIGQLFTLKQVLEAKGIEGRPFVCSCSLESIKNFYESKEWDNCKTNRRKFEHTLFDLIDVI